MGFVEPLAIPEVCVIRPRRFVDDRGWFAEVYNERTFQGALPYARFVQDNHSYSKRAGTVRGLHFQAPPFAQAKLVRVSRGRVRDVAVDTRVGSPTYGRWVWAELSAEGGEQIFVPEGFLHGFATLEPDTEVQYKVTNSYSAAHEGAVRWDDPELAIDWGIDVGAAVVSEKDRSAPPFAALVSPFAYLAQAS